MRTCKTYADMPVRSQRVHTKGTGVHAAGPNMDGSRVHQQLGGLCAAGEHRVVQRLAARRVRPPRPRPILQQQLQQRHQPHLGGVHNSLFRV